MLQDDHWACTSVLTHFINSSRDFQNALLKSSLDEKALLGNDETWQDDFDAAVDAQAGLLPNMSVCIAQRDLLTADFCFHDNLFASTLHSQSSTWRACPCTMS